MKKNIISTIAVVALYLLIATQASAYTVKSGDTLWKISQDLNIPLYDLQYVNNEWDDVLYVGQEIETPSYINAADKDVLARLVRAEAESEPYAGKVAVATVVLNRVESNDFPDTIKDVIYQVSNGYYQFTPVANGQIDKKADAESIKAVEEAVLFQGSGSGSLFFYNPKIATSDYVASRDVTTVIGNHVFAK